MCWTCTRTKIIEESVTGEEYKSFQPSIVTMGLIYAYYSHCITGGELHAVLDDMNVEDHNILWCLENNLGKGICDKVSVSQHRREATTIANRLLKLKPWQRAITVWAEPTPSWEIIVNKELWV